MRGRERRGMHACVRCVKSDSHACQSARGRPRATSRDARRPPSARLRRPRRRRHRHRSTPPSRPLAAAAARRVRPTPSPAAAPPQTFCAGRQALKHLLGDDAILGHVRRVRLHAAHGQLDIVERAKESDTNLWLRFLQSTDRADLARPPWEAASVAPHELAAGEVGGGGAGGGSSIGATGSSVGGKVVASGCI